MIIYLLKFIECENKQMVYFNCSWCVGRILQFEYFIMCTLNFVWRLRIPHVYIYKYTFQKFFLVWDPNIFFFSLVLLSFFICYLNFISTINGFQKSIFRSIHMCACVCVCVCDSEWARMSDWAKIFTALNYESRSEGV